jgi:hypothetical protein
MSGAKLSFNLGKPKPKVCTGASDLSLSLTPHIFRAQALLYFIS